MHTDNNTSLSAHEFCWGDGQSPESHAYLAPPVLAALKRLSDPMHGRPLRILDLGCGNGAFSARMRAEGYEVVACDHSESGIRIARQNYPQIEFFSLDLNEGLPVPYRHAFDAVVSLEVIEHLFQPRVVFSRAKEALGVGGHAIISTPYHGYMKNLSLAVLNRCDEHWHPLRDFGHIKFFSRKTFVQCASECGFRVRCLHRVGRVPVIAKSMIMVAAPGHADA